MWTTPQLLHIVFFYTVALFYGHVLNQIRRERQRGDRGFAWARELEAKVAERTEELRRVYRERAEEALKLQTRVLESMVEGVFLADPDGTVRFTNRAEDAMFGYPQGELIGRDMSLLTGTGAAIAEQLAAVGIWRGELDNRKKDGTGFATSTRISTLEMSGKQYWLGLQEDVTERKRAAEALAEKARELARSNADLEQFAYVASHDLQEPLRMVGSYTQLLATRYKEKLDADGRDFIGFALGGVTRMRDLIEGLLAYSRAGSRPRAVRMTDCETILEHTLANLRVAIAESGAVVTRDPLPAVVGDDVLLGQLFDNLLRNAIKFRGPNRPELHVGAVRNGGDWVFSVRDNGIGLDPSYADRIFVIFERLHAGDEYAGTGIGLAVCKKIVEGLGGTIWVESELGAGSTFAFTIAAADDGAPL